MKGRQPSSRAKPHPRAFSAITESVLNQQDVLVNLFLRRLLFISLRPLPYLPPLPNRQITSQHSECNPFQQTCLADDSLTHSDMLIRCFNLCNSCGRNAGQTIDPNYEADLIAHVPATFRQFVDTSSRCIYLRAFPISSAVTR